MRSNKTIITATVSLLLGLILFTSSLFAGELQKVTVRVDGLACPFCAYGMEKKLKRMENLEKLDIKINEGLVILFFKKGAKIDKELIAKKIKEAGFTPREITIETPRAHKVTLNIEGMRCQGCVARVKEALKKIECTREVSVNLEKKEAYVICSGDKKDQKKLVDTVKKLGFKAKIVDAGNGEQK